MNVRVLVAMFVLAVSSLAQAQTPGQGDGNYIVTFRAGTSQADRAAAVRGSGAALRFNFSIVDAVAISAAGPNALAALGRNPAVLSIVPDRRVQAIQRPEDVEANAKPGGGGGGSTGEVTPAGVTRVGVPTATSNGAGVGVAIVDTGIDLNNADLAPGGATFSAFGGSCQDDNGHGTHVAGTVAALDNSIGVLGVAPAATPYCVKVLDAQGNGADSNVIAGLDWVAAQAGAIKVVNMSLGREGTVNDNPALHAAVQSLYNNGIVIVVAAGNDAAKEVKDMIPAGYPEVIAAASTTAVNGTNKCRRYNGFIAADTASYFTTDGAFIGGAGVSISAPGEEREDINSGCLINSVGILSLKVGGGTLRSSGTSMASPHVAGVVARMIQGGVLGVENIRFTIRSNAQRLGSVPLDSPTSSYTFDLEREGIVKAP